MPNRLFAKLPALLVTGVLVSLSVHSFLRPAWAESTGHESGAEAAADHEFHSNIVALFVGVTGEGRRETGFAFGIEYERRLTESFGIGALVERTAGDLEFWVAAVPFAWHSGPWKLYAAPGIEDIDGDSGVNELLRLGVEYGFEAGRWEIAPQLDYDIVAGENAVIVGVVFGYPF